MNGVIPEHLSKRDCVGKVAEVFDPLDRVNPLIAGMKLDIHELNSRKLDWDSKIPEDLKKIWASNFKMIQEISKIRFHRAIVPSEAIKLDIEAIDVADASPFIICVAINARFKRRNGEYSCQLVFARTKIVPKDMSMPHAELLAAILNATTGHVVKVSFGDKHKYCWKITDNQVLLHWVNSTRYTLKMWVKNRIIEIQRLSNPTQWKYVESKKNIADIGTRKRGKIV